MVLGSEDIDRSIFSCIKALNPFSSRIGDYFECLIACNIVDDSSSFADEGEFVIFFDHS